MNYCAKDVWSFADTINMRASHLAIYCTAICKEYELLILRDVNPTHELFTDHDLYSSRLTQKSLVNIAIVLSWQVLI